MTQPTKPIAEVKSGKIVASIWRNETEKGTRHNVTFSRLYKTEEGQWKRSESFGRDDLLLLAKVADLAHSEIARRIEQPDEE
jgi:hypothetical protein